jgi:hypothetical protein
MGEAGRTENAMTMARADLSTLKLLLPKSLFRRIVRNEAELEVLHPCAGSAGHRFQILSAKGGYDLRSCGD